MFYKLVMNLEEKSLKTLEFDKICLQLANFAKSQQSRQLCLDLQPRVNIEDIKLDLTCTKEAKSVLDNGGELPLEYIVAISELKQNNFNNYLSEQELINIAKTIRTARLVKNFLKENLDTNAKLNALALRIYPNKELEDEIFNKIDEELNVKNDATPTLENLLETLKTTERGLKDKVNELLNDTNFVQKLQEPIYTIRDNRVVFPVMASAKNKVSGITHDISATNKTSYIEPVQIIPINNKIKELKSKINAEIVKILSDLTKKIKSNTEHLELNEKLLATIDFHFAKARYAVSIQAVEPELATQKTVKIQGMKHPLLIGNIETIVANDIELGYSYKSLIITGSNTGGKTITLKTVGLFILMTKAGMFLPCLDAKIYPFEKVFADIGDEQSIAQSLSTFSSHMTNLIKILDQSDANTFIVIDEICAGTDPQEGSVLAEVILDALSSKQALSLISTHFAQLKTLEYTNNYFKNACVEFNKETLKPTYKLTVGIPGASNAIFIAANLGLTPLLVNRAKDVLNLHRDPSAIIVEKLQETQQKLSENLRDVEYLKNESLKLKDEYEIKISTLKNQKRKTLRSIETKFNLEFKNIKSEIKDIIEELTENKNLSNARRSLTKLNIIEQNVQSQIDNLKDKQAYDSINWSTAQVNDEVMIREVNQPVKILTLPDKNDSLTVQMGLIKTKIKKDQLVKYNKLLVGKPKLKVQPLQLVEFRKSGLSNTLDLRGYRVEEALDTLEDYLDKASLTNLSPLYIIHGHGTGALKSSLRDYISTSPYVAKYRAGEPAEGGDGVSVLDLN